MFFMRKRKLLYVPGLISLVGLPILLFIFPIEDTPPYKVALRFHIPASDNSTINHFYTDHWVQSQMKTKKITGIYLDSHEYYDEAEKEFYKKGKFDLISREMQRLSFVGDSSIVLQVELGPKNTYGEWVKLLNLATIYQLRRYTFSGNSFYFLGNIPLQQPEPIIFDSIVVEPVELDIDVEPWTPPTKLELFIEDLSRKWDEFVYILNDNLRVVIPFVALIIVPWIFWIRRNFKRKAVGY